MWKKLAWTLLMSLAAAGAGAETVYKWMDSRGQVHYTDLPPRQADAKILGVYHDQYGLGEEGGGGEDAGTAPPGPPATTPPAGSDFGDASSETVASVQQDVANARSEQCTKAQERYKLYIESRRLFREGANGQREYLSDRELAEARIRAKQAVDEFCSG